MSSSNHLTFYNTLSRTKEKFTPIEGNRVRMYSCGPTVYNYAHIGNMRAMFFPDILKRFLRYRGFEVFHVMNITDVDDKIIRDCEEAGEDLKTFTLKYESAFFEDLKALGIEKADHHPRATEHIPEMIELVTRLEEAGFTYTSEGSVYFRVEEFKDYGKLSGIEVDGLQSGARVDQDEYDKENARDFVLWKSNRGEDAKWDSPWGVGRPGWHLECSCMSMKYLGESFDIHTGGEDLIFPHHENEIAQSEGTTGKPLARFWLHNKHLLVDGGKMSKSAGNFYTLRDLMDQGFDPIDIRYSFLTAHYGSILDFSIKALEQAKAARRRLLDFKRRMEDLSKDHSGGRKPRWLKQAKSDFETALDNDLQTPKALSVLFDLVSEGNVQADKGELSCAGAEAVSKFLVEVNSIFGILEEKNTILPEEIEQLIVERRDARKNKDYARSDQIRDELQSQGIVLKDTPDGTQWHIE